MFTSERQWKRDFPGHSWSLGRSFHRVHCGYDALYIQTPKNIKELRHMRMPYKPCFHCCQAATAMKAIFWPSSAKCAHFCDVPYVVGLLRHFREVYEGVKQRDLQATKMENELMFHHCHWNAQMYLRYSSYHHHVYIYILYNTIPKRSVPIAGWDLHHSRLGHLRWLLRWCGHRCRGRRREEGWWTIVVGWHGRQNVGLCCNFLSLRKKNKWEKMF